MMQWLVFCRPLRSLCRMNVLLRCLPALIGGCLALGPARAEMTLIVAADTPSAEVTPRRAGRSFLRLPAIEYQFDLKAECDDNWSAESLRVSVADTHTALGAQQLVEDASIRLRIPAKQIAPLVLEDFCVARDAEEDERKMTYATQSLDVDLVCARDEGVDDPE